MNDGQDGAPTSPATASALKGPSEATSALEERAARARDDEAEAAAERRDQQAQEDARRARDDARKRAHDRRAPTGFFRSMRFFTLGIAGMLLLVAAATNALEGPMFPWPPFLGVVGAWVLVLLALWADALTWRRRVPFSIDGYDELTGSDRSGSSEAPWVALEVGVVLGEDSSEAHAARMRAMEILASRANAMLNKDEDLKPTTGQRWRVNETTSVVRGESTLAIYTTRLLEKWMRNEVRLLANSHPVKTVRVRARYTGASSRIPD